MLFMILLLLVGVSFHARAEGPVQILPLGNSITQGDRAHQSYRYKLWKLLVESGIRFDFVGSERDNHKGNPVWPDYAGRSFDRDHEGHWGWRVDKIYAQMPGWLFGSSPGQGLYTPDIVLFHLGTNDAFQGEPTSSIVAEIKETLKLLRSKNGNVTILLAKLIPTTERSRQRRIDKLNAEIDGIAAEMHRPNSRVYVVDQADGFNAATDTYDGTHPNASGESKMAQKWFDALVIVLSLRIMPLGNPIKDAQDGYGSHYPLHQNWIYSHPLGMRTK